MLKIEIDEHSGFCFGVTTAIRKAEEELQKGSIKIEEKGYNHILFDTAYYTYDSILSFMQKIKGKNLKIATYSTKTKILITDGAIYSNDGLIAD
jgi:hypothetical protein